MAPSPDGAARVYRQRVSRSPGRVLALWGQSVFGWYFEVQPQVELFLPLVGFFADVLRNRGRYMPPASKPSSRGVTVVEFALGVQVALRHRIPVGLQRVRRVRAPRSRDRSNPPGPFSLNVIKWLARQGMPLVLLDWQGGMISVVGDGSVYGPALREAQLVAKDTNLGLKISLA